MKKNSGYLVFLLALIFLASPNSVQAQQVDSDVGITFYQKSYKDQIIPMKKVINDQKKDNLSLEVSDKNNLLNKLLPKTNEKQELKYIVLGLLFLSIVLVIIVRKNKKIYK